MFIFKSKNQKLINKKYRELETLYKKLDRLKEDLYKYRDKEGLSTDIRNEIKQVQEEIHNLKVDIIKLEE
jgi:hypothetical protein